MVEGDFGRLLGSLTALLPAQLVMLDAAVRGQMALSAPAPPQVTPMATPSISAIEARFAQAPACPHCACQAIKKWGSANGIKRYRCKRCRVTSNALPRRRWPGCTSASCGVGMPRPWSRASRCARSRLASTCIWKPPYHWQHRFLMAPKDLKPKALTGTVEADELDFLYSQNGARDLTRPARKRGGKAQKPVLSHEQVPF